jgi:hypothetical protein
MPPAPDDASAADVLQLHWKMPLPEPVYASPRCCCPPPNEVVVIINAGCQVHGLKSYHALRSAGSTIVYGFGR